MNAQLVERGTMKGGQIFFDVDIPFGVSSIKTISVNDYDEAKWLTDSLNSCDKSEVKGKLKKWESGYYFGIKK